MILSCHSSRNNIMYTIFIFLFFTVFTLKTHINFNFEIISCKYLKLTNKVLLNSKFYIYYYTVDFALLGHIDYVLFCSNNPK